LGIEKSSATPAPNLFVIIPLVGEGNYTIVFFPGGAFGPTNNCVGIGDVLRRRGHRVLFIIDESFEGMLEQKGFVERLVRLTPRPESPAPSFRKPTIEQLAEFVAPTFNALIDGAKHVDDRLHQIIREIGPDLIVADNVITFPALAASGRPWARIASRNPTEMKDHEVPPPFSGLPLEAFGPTWDEYWVAYRDALKEIHDDFDDFCQDHGAPPLPTDDFIHESPWLNLYLYPDEVDYRRVRPLGPHWHNVQASVRDTDPAWDLPEPLVDRPGPLIYLSLGSLGSADVELMRSLIDSLASDRYRVIVSKGPQAKQLELPDSMVGAEFLPQTSVLPEVDLVITHGGNNTVTESLYFGKPMVVLPLFWDQHDNAQRLQEKGYGVRLDTYGHEPGELTGAVDRLLGDEELAGRLAATSRRLQDFGGTELAANLIERAALEGQLYPA
jgi:MGT family glycosyltransferase